MEKARPFYASKQKISCLEAVAAMKFEFLSCNLDRPFAHILQTIQGSIQFQFGSWRCKFSNKFFKHQCFLSALVSSLKE
jgi:hypothetical protein